jgi:AraC-like DNA-binding protein
VRVLRLRLVEMTVPRHPAEPSERGPPGRYGFRTRLVAPTLAWLRARGCVPQEVIRRAGLPDTSADLLEVPVQLAELRRFFDIAAEAAADPDLGVAVVPSIPVHNWDLLDYCCLNAPTVRGALARVERYFALFNEHAILTISPTPAGATLDMRVPGEPLFFGQHGNQLWLGMAIDRIRRGTRAHIKPLRCWLAHPEPRPTRGFATFAGTDDVTFGSESNGFELRAADLDTPVVGADPVLLSVLDSYAERELAERGPAHGLLGRVRDLVRRTLPEPPPPIDAIAERLRMSPRTLQRQLAESGTTYRDIVDRVREQLARFHLEAGRSTDEIAYLLGYSERAPFLRAFQRWTGRAPADFRRR